MQRLSADPEIAEKPANFHNVSQFLHETPAIDW
jgi:hypothetical protein